MTRYENEGYRPREGLSVTLSQDDRTTTSEDHPVTRDDLYHSKPLAPTVSADDKVTIGETDSGSTSSRKRGRKRIIKAIKMLTSAVATVTIAATLVGGGMPGGEDRVPDVPGKYPYYYSWFGPTEDGRGFSFSENSENSYFIQAFGGGQGFRIESNDPDVRLMCHEAYAFNGGGIYVCLSDDDQERFSTVMEIAVDEISALDEKEWVGTIEVAETGEVFHYRAMQVMYGGQYIRTPEEFGAALEIALSKVTFRAVDYDNWNRVQIGGTMFSTTDRAWYGIGAGGGNEYDAWQFSSIGRSSVLDVSSFTKLSTRTINDITWTFYLDRREDSFWDTLWCKPDQEDILLGVLLGDMSEIVGDDLQNMVDHICETGLGHVHLLDNRDAVLYEPQPPTDDTTGTPVVSSPDLVLYDNQYPWFRPSSLTLGLSTVHTSSNSGWVQFGLNGVNYRMEAATDQIHMMIIKLLGDATSAYHDVYEGGWQMIISDEDTGLNVGAYFALDPKNLYTDGEMELTGELWAEYPGRTLYYSLQGASVTSSGAYSMDEATFRKQAAELLSKLQFTQPDPNNWNRVQLGNTMYSEMTTEWAGISSGDTNYIVFESISKASLHDLSNYKYIMSRGINGITWHFFADTTYSSLYDMRVWCIPGHEDIAFGMRCGPLLIQEFDVDGTIQPSQVPQNNLEQLADRLEEAALCYIHGFPGADLTATLQIPSQPETPTVDPVVTPVLTVSSEYPRWGGQEAGYGWQVDPVSYNSSWVQFGFNGSIHRLTTDADNLHMMLISLVGDHVGLEDPYFQNYINVMVRDINTGYGVEIGFAPTEDTLNSGDENSITGTILTYSGQELLFRTHNLFGYKDLTEAKAWLQKLIQKIYFAEPDPAEWGRVQLGNLMYCQTTENWSVFSSGQNAHFRVNGTVYRVEDLDLSRYQLLDTRMVNQVSWTFYYDDTLYDFYGLKIWAVPAHQDFVLGFDATLMYYGLGMPYSDVGDIEDAYKLQAVDYIVDNAISTYHLLPGVNPDEYVKPVVTISQQYPSFLPDSDNVLSIAHNPYSQNSSFAQVDVNDTVYRIESASGNLHLMITDVTGPINGATYTGVENSFELLAADPMTGFAAYIRFFQDPDAVISTGGMELMGEITIPSSGQMLYYRAVPSVSSAQDTLDAFQRKAAAIISDLQFMNGNFFSWNTAGIGTTMYSEVHQFWSGISSGRNNYFGFDFMTTLEKFMSVDYLDPQYITTETVNDITWHFYYVPGETLYDLMLWCIPAHEEIALGMLCGRAMTEGAGLSMGTIGVDYLMFDQTELESFVNYVINNALENFHPLYNAVTTGDTVSIVPPILETYAQILPDQDDIHSYTVQPISSNSSAVQFSMGGQIYRLEAADEDIFISLSMALGEVGDVALYGSDAVIVDIADLKAGYANSFLLTLENLDFSVSACHGSLVDEVTGTTLYYSLREYTQGMTDSQNRGYAQDLLTRVRFTAADEAGWSRLQIGDSIYMQTSADWHGFGDQTFAGCGFEGGADFEFLVEEFRLDSSGFRHILSATVNDIDWTIYYDTEGIPSIYSSRILLVAEDEGLVLGFPCMERLIAQGHVFASTEDVDVPDDQLQILGEYVVGNLLPMFHLIEN